MCLIPDSLSNRNLLQREVIWLTGPDVVLWREIIFCRFNSFLSTNAIKFYLSSYRVSRSRMKADIRTHATSFEACKTRNNADI